MKKILFWIIAFLWIWLSFCSAEDINIRFDSLIQSSIYDSDLNLLSSTYSLNLTWRVWTFSDPSNQPCQYKYFLISKGYEIVYFTWLNWDIYLNEICFTTFDSNLYTHYLVINGVNYSLISSWDLRCSNFSSPLLVSDNSFTYKIHSNIYWDKLSVLCESPELYFYQSTWVYFFPFYDNSYIWFQNIDSVWQPYSYIPLPVFIDFSYSYQSNPKLKVNYWNTSYEYEIDWSNDVEIHLKSPVVMSWSYNYIYDWPIWINLFYNNTSQFYDKDKLYLKSSYWYNNNIFTPICL
jgi:hypothetical protein